MSLLDLCVYVIAIVRLKLTHVSYGVYGNVQGPKALDTDGIYAVIIRVSTVMSYNMLP